MTDKTARRNALIALLDSDEFRNSPCATVGPTNLWISSNAKDAVLAKSACTGCPVRAGCAGYAVEYREPEGVWGGLDLAERESIQRRTARNQHRQNKNQRMADQKAALAGVSRFTRPDKALVRTARQLQIVQALCAADGDMRLAADTLVGTGYAALCSQYKGMAARVGLPDPFYENVPEVLTRLAVALAAANLGQAA
ncbi:WhiB family transcriptional regulator (plasmid) [Kitasatospora sp. NBC_01246]|uniref:WhiB family transcriptional regulator n=1 Tax=Kitasatospora sp. NBC_01246 TaxID=2903570 RepID=UPI002E32D307|nr:WhiB family transcriptional regulator [Kitasatospora sp. NBC_01246]